MGRHTVTQLTNQINRVLGHYTWLVTHLAKRPVHGAGGG